MNSAPADLPSSTFINRKLRRGLFSAAGHVVDEGSIDIRTAATDRIEQRICIRHKIFGVGQLVSDNLRIAGFAEHHQAARHSDSLSS